MFGGPADPTAQNPAELCSAKVTGTGDQCQPTDDDLIRTDDVTVAVWCNRSAQLGGCATVPGRAPGEGRWLPATPWYDII